MSQSNTQLSYGVRNDTYRLRYNVGKRKVLSQKTSFKVYSLYLLQLLNLILVKANFKSAYTSTRFQFDITAVQYSRRLI